MKLTLTFLVVAALAQTWRRRRHHFLANPDECSQRFEGNLNCDT
jgi:hypothetical protein